jgi:hypothetical protein
MEEISEKITNLTGNYYVRRRFFTNTIMVEVESTFYPYGRFYRKAKPGDLVELLNGKV